LSKCKVCTSVGKGYDSGGLFRFSLLFDNNVVNHVMNHESNVWHSRLCHVNFGRMMRLASLSLIPKFTSLKNSKCHICVESKQNRKPHNIAEASNLAPLELVHSDMSEMNGVLTKGGKRYFMTLIDDSTIFCYIYLLKSKDEVLHYFKIYKAEVENQLERKIKHPRSVEVANNSVILLIHYVRNTVLFMRGHHLIRRNPMGLLKERIAC
jgi:hypothetical protein